MNQLTDSDAAADRPSNPMAILENKTMSDQQKLDYLDDWRLDLVERQAATSENMPADAGNAENDVGEQLRRVTQALAALRGKA